MTSTLDDARGELLALADDLIGIQEDLADETARDTLGMAAHYLRKFAALSPDQGTVSGSPDHPGSDTSSGHPSAENDAMRVALLEIEQISDYCVNAEHYTAERALSDLQEIRSTIKRIRSATATSQHQPAPTTGE